MLNAAIYHVLIKDNIHLIFGLSCVVRTILYGRNCWDNTIIIFYVGNIADCSRSLDKAYTSGFQPLFRYILSR